MLRDALKPGSTRLFITLTAATAVFLASASHGDAAAKPASKPAAKSRGTKQKPAAAPAANAAGQTLAPAAATPRAAAGWGQYLDLAHELTYWDRNEIADWRTKREAELGKPLAAFIKEWSDRIEAKEAAGDMVERDYLRLASAQTVEYLQSGKTDSLDGAARTLSKLDKNRSMPKVAYWTGYVKALQALETGDGSAFVNEVYGMWNNGVLYIEQGALAEGTEAAAGKGAPFHYRNIVNLVVNRAIIEKKMAGLDPLGPLVLMIKARDMEETKEEGTYLTTLVNRIAGGMTAPESDRYRLNFTVAMIEGRRLQQAAAGKIDGEGMTHNAWDLFDRARKFDNLAIQWAASPRSSGAVEATTNNLDLTSLAIQRLEGNEKAAAYQHFASLPGRDGSSALLSAMAVFNDVAAFSEGGWERIGYGDRETYVKSSRRLWRSIMEHSLWAGDYYLRRLDAASGEKAVSDAAPPMQVVLTSYLEFLAAQRSRGFSDVIPDSAYFGAAEAAEKVAYSYRKMLPYAPDSTTYNLWFFRTLQSRELYPLDPQDIARTAATLRQEGRYNLFLDNFVPLGRRFASSAAVRSWLETASPDAARPVREFIASIDQVFTPGKKASPAPAPAPLAKLREELQRDPEHPVHRLLKAFYLEEIGKRTSFSALLENPMKL